MNTPSKLGFLTPNWPCAAHIKACSTVRYPRSDFEFSSGCFAGLNLATHVGDDAVQVLKNRQWLQKTLNPPSQPIWLNQTHSTTVLNYEHCAFDQAPPPADALIAFRKTSPQGVCLVMTADCLPVLLTDLKGSVIAAVHAGWKGLLNGVLENAVSAMGDRPHTIMAWLAPAIGANAFEVGPEVVEAFVTYQSDAQHCFTPHPEHSGKWLADIYALAKLRLNMVGVKDIYGGDACTYADPEHFYSYRFATHHNLPETKGVTGRMASLIWFDEPFI